MAGVWKVRSKHRPLLTFFFFEVLLLIEGVFPHSRKLSDFPTPPITSVEPESMYKYRYKQSVCGDKGFGPFGNFSSPGYPEHLPSNYHECDWELQAAPDQRILVTFTEVDLPDIQMGGRCLAAFITWGGYDRHGRRVVQDEVCGEGAISPNEFQSKNAQAWIRLIVTGRYGDEVYQKHRGLHFTYYAVKSDLRQNHLIVGIVLGIMIPAICCTPIIWYYTNRRKTRANNVARTIARQKFYRKKMVHKVLNQSQKVVEASRVNENSKLYAVSAFMCSEDDTTFESVEVQKRMQEGMRKLDQCRKVEVLLSAIDSNKTEGLRASRRESMDDLRSQIYGVKPDITPTTNTMGFLSTSTPYPTSFLKGIFGKSDENNNRGNRNKSRGSKDLNQCDLSRIEGGKMEDSVFESDGANPTDKGQGRRKQNRHRMSLAYSAPSMTSIAEQEELFLHPQGEGGRGDLSMAGDDSVFVREGAQKSVRFSEYSPQIFQIDESKTSEDGSVVREEETEAEDEMDGEVDDALFFDAETGIEVVSQGSEEECVDEMTSLSSHDNLQELNSESGSNEIAII